MTSDDRPLRALLLDDDPYALEFLKTVLEERYPDLAIETRLQPDPDGDFDLYFLDDDFEGIRLAGKLARRIRTRQEDAIVLAFSASLDEETLKELLGAGCNGVCDKKEPGDMPDMLESLDRCMLELERSRRHPRRPQGGSHLFATFRELFREWNLRLGNQEGDAGPPR